MRTSLATLVAALIICAGVPEAFAESGRAKEDFETIDRIGTAWAYNAFLQQYPTGQYAGLARERIALIARHPRPPQPQAPVTSPNYGDNYFMRRHLKIER